MDPVVGESSVVETPLERKREDKDPEEDAKRRRLPVEEKEKRSSESRKEDRKEGKKEKHVKRKGGFDGREDKRELGDAKEETTSKVPRYSQASDGWLELTNGEEEAGKQGNRELEEKKEGTMRKMPKHSPSRGGQLELADAPMAIMPDAMPAVTDETMQNEVEKRDR